LGHLNCQTGESYGTEENTAAMCGKLCVAEVEEIVPTGSIDPDHIHLGYYLTDFWAGTDMRLGNEVAVFRLVRDRNN
jgi:hypothetical protein